MGRIGIYARFCIAVLPFSLIAMGRTSQFAGNSSAICEYSYAAASVGWGNDF
jgi:hypothetical protein